MSEIWAWDDHPIRPQGRPRGHCRRWPGVYGQHDRQGQCQEGKAARQGDVIAALPGLRRTPLRCSSGLRQSWRRIRAILRALVVELAKDWRTDRYLRRLEAMMAVADRAPR